MDLGGKRVARGGLQGAPPRPFLSLPPRGGREAGEPPPTFSALLSRPLLLLLSLLLYGSPVVALRLSDFPRGLKEWSRTCQPNHKDQSSKQGVILIWKVLHEYLGSGGRRDEGGG